MLSILLHFVYPQIPLLVLQIVMYQFIIPHFAKCERTASNHLMKIHQGGNISTTDCLQQTWLTGQSHHPTEHKQAYSCMPSCHFQSHGVGTKEGLFLFNKSHLSQLNLRMTKCKNKAMNSFRLQAGIKMNETLNLVLQPLHFFQGMIMCPAFPHG